MAKKKKPPARARAPAPPPIQDQMEPLDSRLVEDMAELREEVSRYSIERDVSLIVLTPHLADESLRLDRRAAEPERAGSPLTSPDSASADLRITDGRLGSVKAEMDEMKRAVDRAVSNLELKATKVKGLEAKIRKTDRDFDVLDGIMEDFEGAIKDADTPLVKSICDQLQTLAPEKHRLKAELGETRNELDSAKEEKEEAEKRLVAESVQMLGGLGVKMGEMAAQRAVQDANIAGLQIEVQELQSNVSKLEVVCKDHALLQDDRDGDLHAERGKAECPRVQVVELKESKNWVEEELERFHNEFALMKIWVEEMEERFLESQMLLDDLKWKVQNTVSGLEGENSQLRAARDAARRELDAEREDNGRLQVQIEKLEKGRDVAGCGGGGTEEDW